MSMALQIKDLWLRITTMIINSKSLKKMDFMASIKQSLKDPYYYLKYLNKEAGRQAAIPETMPQT